MATPLITHSLHNMKQVIKLRPNSYVHLDSYGEAKDSFIANMLITLVVVGIAAMTGAAAVGVDITNIQPITIQQSK